MFPFSMAASHPAPVAGRHTSHSGCELIAFDAEKMKVFAAEVRYCEPHWHSAPELVAVVNGQFTLAIGPRSLTLDPGSLVWLNGQQVHSLQARQPASQLVTVQFAPELFDALHPAPELEWCCTPRPEGEVDRRVQQRLLALLSGLVNHAAPFQRIAALYLLLDALVAAGQPVQRAESTLREEAMIKRGIDFINQHFDQPLTLSEVAHHSGMSYSWFSRLFKKVSRHNFKEYLTLVRLNKARLLLQDTRNPITDISHCCGFQQHKYLIAAFNKYCGQTPTEYRKRYVSQQNQPDATRLTADDSRYLALNHELLETLGRHFGSVRQDAGAGESFGLTPGERN